MRAQPGLPTSDRQLPRGAGQPSRSGGLQLVGCSSGSAGGSWLLGTGGCRREGTGDVGLGMNSLECPPSKPTASLT